MHDGINIIAYINWNTGSNPEAENFFWQMRQASIFIGLNRHHLGPGIQFVVYTERLSEKRMLAWPQIIFSICLNVNVVIVPATGFNYTGHT